MIGKVNRAGRTIGSGPIREDGIFWWADVCGTADSSAIAERLEICANAHDGLVAAARAMYGDWRRAHISGCRYPNQCVCDLVEQALRAAGVEC